MRPGLHKRRGDSARKFCFEAVAESSEHSFGSGGGFLGPRCSYWLRTAHSICYRVRQADELSRVRTSVSYCNVSPLRVTMSTSFWSTSGPTSRVSPFDPPAAETFCGCRRHSAVLHDLGPCLAGGFLLVDDVERDPLTWFAFRRRSRTTLLPSKSLRLD